MKHIKLRLIIMNFLQFAVWGAYLTSMGSYLANAGQGANIGVFYAMQGITSIFMPALIGIVADRWIPAQKMMGICHLISSTFLLTMGYYGLTTGNQADFGILITLFAIGIGFYMPSLSLSYAVAYNALEKAGHDTITAFPPIRTLGTVGFICTMLLVDALGFQTTSMQFIVSGILGIILGFYAMTLPECPINKSKEKKSLVDALGLRAFSLFKDRTMATFLIFSLLLGVALQLSNSYANPFISSFGTIEEYANTFGAQHANALISLSQCSETLCILLIPFFMKRFGIKQVMLFAMLAWVLRFGLFGAGNPGNGVWMFILSMIIYGAAFDFFNISGSLFVNQTTDKSMRSSAQGLFMLMTNGIGATLGTIGAQTVVNHYIENVDGYMVGDWSTVWYIFAAYALILSIAFALIFKYKHIPQQKNG
ncbi:MAG: MFS transporter [Bacteroidaceae bacterium]|nr:MFS transporter [Bacteroidaceae bacterium]